METSPEEPTPSEFIPTESVQQPAQPIRRHRRGRIVAGSTALALGLVAGGFGLATAVLPHTTEIPTGSSSGSSGNSGAVLPNQRFQPGSAQRAGEVAGTAATSAQKVGVVTIVSTVDYDASEQAAGTGTILTSGGLILTNNHVIEGSTSIRVTVQSTDRTYTATVVGTDVTDDIAVLKLSGASGLSTATYATTGTAATGDAVTAIGNAQGTGELVSATGTITATGQAISVQGDTTDETESLSNLIETSADVVPGDSGGPLLDSSGHIVGIDTAASSGQSQTVGYAIPIAEGLSIAKQIESGTAAGNVTIGYPAFLGVELANSSTAATVAGAIDGTPAETAGLGEGDTITSVDGQPVADSEALSDLIASHDPGDSVSVGWTDAAGASHTATVTLTAGPAL
jgi:S1-C subfamily serine protease